MRKEYLEQVALLVETIPFIAREQCFALKGGTAINLFFRNMPRISVDIDLSYTPFDDRATAYGAINAALNRIAGSLSSSGYSAVVQGSTDENKLIVSNRLASIKIEPNYTIRGHIYQPSTLGICGIAEHDYAYVEMQVISFPELFGGKMCAALDRQHPRDLFDISLLLASENIDERLMKGFIAMLLSHNRPLHELLNPVKKDQSLVFAKEFIGMTDVDYAYFDHEKALENLVNFIRKGIEPYADFLTDFVSSQSDFSSIDIPNLDLLPAVGWKLQNLKRLRETNPVKFEEQYRNLQEYFMRVPGK